MPDKRVVKAKPLGNGCVLISASWEDEPRETPIAWAVKNFAHGWKAELVVEGSW
jgi:hypothetical protein